MCYDCIYMIRVKQRAMERKTWRKYVRSGNLFVGCIMYHWLHEQCKLQYFARGQIINFHFWISHFECGFCGVKEFIVIVSEFCSRFCVTARCFFFFVSHVEAIAPCFRRHFGLLLLFFSVESLWLFSCSNRFYASVIRLKRQETWCSLYVCEYARSFMSTIFYRTSFT